MAIGAPTATTILQPASGSPGSGGLVGTFLADVTLGTLAAGVSQEPWAAPLVGVTNGLPAGTRILGLVGLGGTAVTGAAGIGLIVSVRDANIEFRSNADMSLTAPTSLAGTILTLLCARQ